MQNTNLNTIKKKLADPSETLFFVNVRNAANNSLIEAIAGGTIRSHGSLEKYLHTLSSNGVKEVILEPRKRNGSSSTKAGTPAILKLENSNVPETTPKKATPAIPQNNYNDSLPGLMGGQIGLGQLVQGQSAIDALQRLERDFMTLSTKYENLLADKERLRDEISRLERANDKLEIEINKKSPLDGVDIGATLPAILALLKPQASPGLNAPQQKQLSPVKDAMRQTVEAGVFPDEIIERCYITLQHYQTGNEKFVKDFEALINENNLKKVNNG